ncbi:phage stabilization family protein [Burkholderia cepacia]|uniref:packaged DNA stabilization protein n=1 Tax=Burkholderia cepacia TaxID=292 RepID=UPI0029904CA2|nr:packaged DNA stabilization protein [Burkholderia cepacia]MDW9228633.1 phage stabilization family protein [Burkholderia cepacia]
MRVPLTIGAYAAKSLIAEAQRCVNLYGEQNPQDAPVPFTYYPTPGLTLVSTPPVAAESRGIYTASNGHRYEVVGRNVYLVTADTSYQLLGVVSTASGPVSMVDNGISMFIVDGSAFGFVVDIGTNVMKPCTDAAFYGADKVDFVDGYFVFNKPGTPQFYISKYLDVTFDSLDIASKSTYSDNLVTHAVMHREIWLFGALTTEIWFNTGASDFTFGRMPGVFIEHGCAAKHSVAKIDLALFWIGRDLQGQGVVFAGRNYQAERISTHALEQEFSTYSRIDDAIGFSYLQGGHAFYVLTFPTANRTWCFDVATAQWHQRAYLEADGSLSRHRMNCHSFNAGRNLVGDWQTGAVYELDQDAYTDNGAPIERIRSFPHILGADGNRVMFRQFIADMEVGAGMPANTTDPLVSLRWSDDRGATWGNAVTATMGRRGEFRTSIQFQRLGYARDRVFELSWSEPIRTALNGAWVDVSRART